MKQLFEVGELAILQSLEAPLEMWNARVTIISVKWMENPLDIYGMPQLSTYVYNVDIDDRLFVQAALRKVSTPDIKIEEQIADKVLL